MTSDPSPWDEISVPGADFHVRRIPDDTAVPCFWGRDPFGNCLFIIELQGDHTAYYRKNVSTVHGIEVDLRSGRENGQRLVMALEQQADRDLFEGLCRTLVSALTHASDSASSLAVALTHIRRWKAFLSGRARRLSPEEVRGLFGELVFLSALLDRWSSTEDAVAAWLGPEKSHQDFIFGNVAVEIKSLSGTERSSVRISSEDQLESLNDALFLRIYRLSGMPEAPNARSLNELVLQVRGRLTAAAAIEEFERKLATHGYAPLPDYDDPRFVITEELSYRVEEGFPRLVRSELPEAIMKVGYDIRLEGITSFECDSENVFGGR